MKDRDEPQATVTRPPVLIDSRLPATGSAADETVASGDRDPLDRVAEEFAERCRRGEAPSIAEYEARFPDQAEKVRKLLGAVAMMEQLRRGSKQARFLPERIGEFRVLRELGRGGMGVVYEAVQESLWRHVAVKAIHHSQLDMKRLQRFQREAQAVAQLHHTNIVPIFGVGEHDGIPYYAMQYIQGRGLDALLDNWRKDHTLPRAERWRRAARFAAQTAEALGYAHEQGVLHRDIKPANLLIDEHDAVWVTDFGLAKMVGHDELTASGDVIGTLRYLAPESLRGISEGRSDVHSLGLTLYEMVTLAPPYGDLTPSELLHRVSEGQPVRPRQVDPTIPRDLETIVLKATARDVKDRYATAVALAHDLHCFLDDRPIKARRANFVERAWRWSRRNRGTAALISLAAASLTLAAIIGWMGFAQAERLYSQEQASRADADRNFIYLSDLFLQLFNRLFPEDEASFDARDLPIAKTLPPDGQDGKNSPMFVDQANGPGFGGPGGPGPGGPGGGGRGRGRPSAFGDRTEGLAGDPSRNGPGGDGPQAEPNRATLNGGRPASAPLDNGTMAGRPRRGPGSAPDSSRTDQLQLLEGVLHSYDEFEKLQKNKDKPDLQSEAAWVYFKLGTLCERLEHRTQADAAFDRTLTIFEELATRHPGNPAYFAKFLRVCAAINPWQTDPDKRTAVGLRLGRMNTLVSRLLATSPGNVDFLRTQMKLLAKMGLIRYYQHQSNAEESFQKALELAGDLIARNPEEGYPHSDRSDVLEAYALVLEHQGKVAETSKLLNAAMEDLEWVADDGLKSLSLATRMESLADVFEWIGDQKRSDEVQHRADEIDPRAPVANRPRPGRPFGPRRLDPAPTPEEVDFR